MFFTKKTKPDVNILKAAFDEQTTQLARKNYASALKMSPEQFHAKLDTLWNNFCAAAGSLSFEQKGQIPLLIVISRNVIPYSEQLTLLGGRTELELNKITASQQTPVNIYLLLDVEDGTNTVAKSPKDCLHRFEKDNRFPLTAEEAGAIVRHYPKTLKAHYLVAAGTFFAKGDEKNPLLWLLDEKDELELHYAWFDIAHGNYGIPSYAIKFTA